MRRVVLVLLTGLLGGYAVFLLVVSPIWLEHPPLGDFGSFYASGQAATQGLDPYAAYPLSLGGRAVNLNAPLSVLLFEPLAPFDPEAVRRTWFVASLVAFGLTVGLLHRRARAGLVTLAWACATTSLWETLSLGQVYAFLALLSTLGWLLVARMPLAAGVCIGLLAAIKPNFLVWPVLLVVAGARRAGVAALGTALVAGVAPIAVHGPRIYAQWFAVAFGDPPSIQPSNGAIGGVLARLGLADLAAPIEALGLLVLAAWVWRARPDAGHTSNLALLAALLFSPIAWVGYGLFLLPLFFERTRSMAVVASATLLLIPRLLVQGVAYQAPLLLISVGSAYCWAWLLLLARQLAPGPRATWLRARLVRRRLPDTPAPS